MTEPLPVTVIGGYLGAGKTTLVNHALRHAEGRRIAVLVNEFGALPIDADLIEGAEDGLISIAGGCICCSFGDDLMGGLLALQAREPRVDHVVIEASGVAIPGSIAASVSLLPEMSLAATVVLADAETVEATARDRYLGDTILRQLADADLVLATKSDLVPDTLAQTTTWLQAQAPRATILPLAHGALANEVLLGPHLTGDAPKAQPHGDPLFASLVLAQDRPANIAQLGQSLVGLTDHGVVRAKGFVQDQGGSWHLIQMVGRRVARSDAPAPDPASAELVVIGPKDRFDPAAIRAAWRTAMA